MNINASNLCTQYSTYKVNVDNVKQKIDEAAVNDGVYETSAAVMELSSEGKVLADKMTSLMHRNVPDDVGHLSSVSTYEYIKAFEDALTEPQRDNPSECFSYHANKMSSVYNDMKENIISKYSEAGRETEYYVADNGNVEELTKEKELTMLDKAYENHSKLMAVSTEIWNGFIDGEKAAKGEIRDLAYQAFMSAKGEKGMNISFETLDKLNNIWDYYAKDISAPEIDDNMRTKVQESANADNQIEAYRLTTKNTNEVMWEHYMDMRAFKAEAFDHNAEYDEEDIMQAVTDAYAAVYQKIIKAHENGDREVDYELTGKSKISLEEDLVGLDAAFERCVSDLEGYLTCKRTNEVFANPDMAWWFERNNRKISTDLNYNFILSDKINSLNGADKNDSESGRLSGRDRFENIAEAYTYLYDEIVKGYEEGKRFIVVADNNKQSGYHVLTMEEELAALD